ncbi:MAG TPA: efflux RND transporter periplasmic adaptor subunit [Gammaproteobacteria bacterium]|nr:efflux RND transporter periplasmic adaptor subunit [Gammaproteobacteria bacterium]
MKRYLASLALLAQVTTAAAVDFPAVLDWSQRAVLSTPVSGVISTVAVSAGEHVSTGQPLLQIDQRPFAAALADAGAQLRKQELNRDEARRELERTRELYERTVISVHDLELEEIAFATAQSDYTSAVAAHNTAKLHMEYSTLHAPFAGLVLAVDVSSGMAVINTQQATPLVTLAQDRPMHALARIDAARLDGIRSGQAVKVNLNGTRFDGSIRHIGAEPDGNGLYTLTIAFDPGDSVLRAGLPAQIEIRP